MAQVRNVGAHRVSGEKPDNQAKRACADGECNLLLCHGNRKPLSRISDFIPGGGHLLWQTKHRHRPLRSHAPRLTALAKEAAAF